MTVQRIDPRSLPPMVREINRERFGRFVAADPYGRRHLNPRNATILYLADGRFGYAMNVRPAKRTLRRLYQQSPVRFYSHGV